MILLSKIKQQQMSKPNRVSIYIFLAIFISCSVSLSCYQHCLQCQSQIQCSNCQIGKLCCDQNCQYCFQNKQKQSVGNVTCIACKDGFTLNKTTNKCENSICAIKNCLNCEENNCKLCQIGYYKSIKSEICLSCQSTCLTCFGSPINCTSCAEGYTLDQNSCLDCFILIPQCQICNSDVSPVTCALCSDGFFVDQTSQGMCSACSILCNTCQNNSSCLSCFEGYALSAKGQCVQCSDNCAICRLQNNSNSNKSNCIQCSQGSILLASESNSSLFICKLCTQYSTHNCAKCLPDGTCTKCFSLYYMVGNQCVSPAFGLVTPWQLTFLVILAIFFTVLAIAGLIYYLCTARKPEYQQYLLQSRQENHS